MHAFWQAFIAFRCRFLFNARMMLKINTRFRPGTVFQDEAPDGSGRAEYVAISAPFPHPDLPIYQIWAVPTQRDEPFREAPTPELVDIPFDTHLTIWGEIVVSITQAIIGFAVIGFLALCGYFVLERLLK